MFPLCIFFIFKTNNEWIKKEIEKFEERGLLK